MLPPMTSVATSADTLRAAIAAQWRLRADLGRIQTDLTRKGRDLAALRPENLAPSSPLGRSARAKPDFWGGN